VQFLYELLTKPDAFTRACGRTSARQRDLRAVMRLSGVNVIGSMEAVHKSSKKSDEDADETKALDAALLNP